MALVGSEYVFKLALRYIITFSNTLNVLRQYLVFDFFLDKGQQDKGAVF